MFDVNPSDERLRLHAKAGVSSYPNPLAGIERYRDKKGHLRFRVAEDFRAPAQSAVGMSGQSVATPRAADCPDIERGERNVAT